MMMTRRDFVRQAAIASAAVPSPEKSFEGFVPPPQTIPNSPGHYVECIEACKGGKPSLANFNYAIRREYRKGWEDILRL